jgi:hypothetical protein
VHTDSVCANERLFSPQPLLTPSVIGHCFHRGLACFLICKTLQRAMGTVAKTGTVTWGAFARKLLATSALSANLQAFTDGPTGLTANTLYQYQVFAVNGLTKGPLSTVNATNAGVVPVVTKLHGRRR